MSKAWDELDKWALAKAEALGRREELERMFADRLLAEDHLSERVSIEEVSAEMSKMVAAGDSPAQPPIARFVAGMTRMVGEHRSIKRAQLGTGYTQALRAAIAASTVSILPDDEDPMEKQARLAALPENYVGMLFGVDCWIDPTLPPDALEFECWPRRDGAA
jgi:hypothetical protein